jgi:long-chain-fatty-acid--CoA ligase ACSBG
MILLLFTTQIGLEANHGVGIIGFNSPEWLITNNAAILAG